MSSSICVKYRTLSLMAMTSHLEIGPRSRMRPLTSSSGVREPLLSTSQTSKISDFVAVSMSTSSSSASISGSVSQVLKSSREMSSFSCLTWAMASPEAFERLKTSALLSPKLSTLALVWSFFPGGVVFLIKLTSISSMAIFISCSRAPKSCCFLLTVVETTLSMKTAMIKLNTPNVITRKIRMYGIMKTPPYLPRSRSCSGVPLYAAQPSVKQRKTLNMDEGTFLNSSSFMPTISLMKTPKMKMQMKNRAIAQPSTRAPESTPSTMTFRSSKTL
mmetsp:Transcript_24002/g.68768  ORF Transcript_24002/g.68768 Transcript_24002/m.68768 type:complete len:274 (+) Transcript_24002:70-891(+)